MSANTIITSIVTGGTNTHTTVAEEANSISTDFVSQGVVGAITLNSGSGGTGSFCVNQNTGSNLAINILAGQAYITATPSSQDSQVLRARASSDYTAYTINSNSSGSTKYDWIYLKVDATAANNPASDASDVTSIYTSRSSSNSTDNGTPPTYGLLLAVVTVANSATAITNSNITDKRFNTSIGAQNGSLIVTQSGTGVDAKIQAAGIDANVALDINSKGTGAINFTAGTSGITGVVNSLYNPYKFSCYLAATNKTSGSGAFAEIPFDTKVFDTGNNLDVTTNKGRFTAPINGFYQFNFVVGTQQGTGSHLWKAALYMNGSAFSVGSSSWSSSGSNTSSGSELISLTASDYVEVYVYGDTALLIATGATCRFSGFLVSAT